MARKKSAAKKAREEQAKLAQEQGITESTPNNEKVDGLNLAEDDDADDDAESSEEEDEYGELLTENVEEQIQSVLSAIKQDPKKLLDPNTKFFDENQAAPSKKSGDKPIYLKDYHRMNLLSGDYKLDDEDENPGQYGTVDGEKPFVVQEREERNQLLADIDNAFQEGSDGDEDDGFLKKKEKPSTTEKPKRAPLPDPNVNATEFLSSYLNNGAWIPKENDKVIDLDQMDKDDEQEFDDAVEEFERAYNFRFEDPSAAEIVSYARNQATLRRGKTNARKRARQKDQVEKEKENQEIEHELQKKKTQKINKVMDRLAKIKEAVGEDIPDETIQRVFGDSLMNDDFDDGDWDSRMAEIFNDQYYESEMAKPEWGEDDEVMAEFHEEQKSNSADEEENAGSDEEQAETASQSTEPAPELSKKKKALKEKKSAKKEKQSLKEKAQSIVEANAIKLRDEVEEERGRGKNDEVKFRYREVSPDSYGLTTREIFLADDQALNNYFSIKKFAPYKPKEQVEHDKKRFTRTKNLKNWRHLVFRDKNGPAKQANEGDNEIWIPLEDEEPARKVKKQKKEKKHSK